VPANAHADFFNGLSGAGLSSLHHDMGDGGGNEKSWRETRRQEAADAREDELRRQGRNVVHEDYVRGDALPLVGFLVCGAGEQLLNGVYLATPQLNEGAPVFHHGLGYLLSRERIKGKLGWVIGMPPSVCYGFRTDAELPPQRAGWAAYGGRPRAPRLRELRSAHWAVAGWAEHSMEHVLGFGDAASNQAMMQRQNAMPHGSSRRASSQGELLASKKTGGQRFATRYWVELAGGFLRLFKGLKEEGEAATAAAPLADNGEGGGNGGGDDPIARGQVALARAAAAAQARAEGHAARPSRELWLPEFVIEHDEDDEGLDGMGSRDVRLRLVGGTAYLSGSQLHVLTLDSGASASSWAVALRETQRCFDGCKMMQSPSAHLAALEKRGPGGGAAARAEAVAAAAAKVGSEAARRQTDGSAADAAAQGEGFDDLEEEKKPQRKRRARASFAMLHGAGSHAAGPGLERALLNERRGSDVEGAEAFGAHVKAEAAGIPWETVRNMRRSGRLRQRVQGSSKWRERFIEVDVDSKTLSISEPPTARRFQAQKLVVVALAGYTVEHLTKPAESGSATRRNGAGDEVEEVDYLLHLWPPPPKAGKPKATAVLLKATTPEEGAEWAHSFGVIVELCRRNEEELLSDFMLFKTRATATGITEASPEDLLAAEERAAVFVFKEGVVFKQPHSQRGWHKRFFVLEDDELRYYADFSVRVKEQEKEEALEQMVARGDDPAASKHERMLRDRAVVKLEKLGKEKSKRTIRLTPGTELISQLTIGLWDEHQPGAAGSASATRDRDHTEPIFTIRASSHNKFVLRADSQGEMADWLKAIKHNIEILRKPYWTKAVEAMRAGACLSAKAQGNGGGGHAGNTAF